MTTLEIPRALANSLLDIWPVARLATVSSGGIPHAVPVVFVRLQEHLFVPVDGKRKRHAKLKRLENIATNPQASLLLDHYVDDWAHLWWIRIDGDADQYEPDHAQAEALAARFSSKYPQYRTTALVDAKLSSRPIYLRLAIHKISAWAQSQSTDTIQAALDILTTHQSGSR